MSTFLIANADLAARAIRNMAPAGTAAAATAAGNYGSDTDGGFDDSTLIHVPISVNAAGVFTVIPGQPGARLSIHALFLFLVAGNDLVLLSAGMPLTGPLSGLPDGFGLSWPISKQAHFLLDAGSGFQIQMSTAAQISGYARYVAK